MPDSAAVLTCHASTRRRCSLLLVLFASVVGWTASADAGSDERVVHAAAEQQSVRTGDSRGWQIVDVRSTVGSENFCCGHWAEDGTYNVRDCDGSFAHRATRHSGRRFDYGPMPLDSPYNPDASQWSIWMGTNAWLNPELHWFNGDDCVGPWQSGIEKSYTVTAPAGTPIWLSFFHRYAVEAGTDTCVVEWSVDGSSWFRAGAAASDDGRRFSTLARRAAGVYTGGTTESPLPGPIGGAEMLRLLDWPGRSGNLHVRFRLAKNSERSASKDDTDYALDWQVDDIGLIAGSVQVGFSDFEHAYDGWRPRRLQGTTSAALGRAGVRPTHPGANAFLLQFPEGLPTPDVMARILDDLPLPDDDVAPRGLSWCSNCLPDPPSSATGFKAVDSHMRYPLGDWDCLTIVGKARPALLLENILASVPDGTTDGCEVILGPLGACEDIQFPGCDEQIIAALLPGLSAPEHCSSFANCDLDCDGRQETESDQKIFECLKAKMPVSSRCAAIQALASCRSAE